MNLNAKSQLYTQLALSLIAFIQIVLSFSVQLNKGGSPLVGGFFGLAGLAILVFFLCLLIDLVSNASITLPLTVISHYKHNSYMLEENGRVKRIRFADKEIIQGLEPGSRILLSTLRLSRIPVHIEIVSAPPSQNA